MSPNCFDTAGMSVDIPFTYFTLGGVIVISVMYYSKTSPPSLGQSVNYEFLKDPQKSQHGKSVNCFTQHYNYHYDKLLWSLFK